MVYIICYLTIPTFAVPQLLLTIVVNPSNLLWAWRLTTLPRFFCIEITTVAKITDGLAMGILYAQLAQTEINPPGVSEKLRIGWVVLLLSQAKFYMGNFNTGSQQYLLQQKRIDKLKRCLCPCFYKKSAVQTYTKRERFFELSRKQLVNEYRLKLRQNIYKLKKEPLNEDSHK